jgi:tetratricopeptide (TPR) repeat protein
MGPIVFLDVSDEEWAKAEEDQKAVPDMPGRDAETQSRSGSSHQLGVVETSSAKDGKGKGKAVDLELSAEWSNTNAISTSEESGFQWANPERQRENAVKIGRKPLMNEREIQAQEFRLARELETWRREHGDHDPTTLERMKELAQSYGARGDYKRAEKVFREILELATEAFGADYPYTLNRLFDLGLALFGQGRIDEGKEKYDHFIEAGKRVLLAESASTSTILADPESNREDDQLTLLKSCIGSAEDLLRSIPQIPPEARLEGPNHWLRWVDKKTEAHLIQVEDEDGFKDLEIGFGGFVATVAGIQAQASEYVQQGRWRKAEQYLLFMLETHEKILGSEHADVLAIRSELAALYETYKQWREAEVQYARLAELKRKSLGERNPEILIMEIMQARMMGKQGFQRLRDIKRVKREIERKTQPVLESFTRLLNMEEVRVTKIDSRSNQASGVTLDAHSELASILGNWADYQRAVAATDTNEPPLNVNRPVQVTPQHDSGGAAEDLSETKSLEDLEEALQADRAAEPGRPDLAGRFSDLSLKYLSAYQQAEESGENLQALDGAIRNAILAIEVAPADAPPDLASMTNLGEWYTLKFERTQDIEDLGHARIWAEQAVECTEQEMDSTGENDQELEKRQDNLGVILSLYPDTGDTTSLENAVEFSKQAAETSQNTIEQGS